MIQIDSVNAGSSVRFRVRTFDEDDYQVDADAVPEIQFTQANRRLILLF